MSFFRTASTRRLLTSLAAAVAIVVAGTTIAVASSSGGPKPPAKPLAQAIHDSLNSPKIDGITAHVTFTNHLIDASNFQGSDPILTGATGRLWISNDGRVRLELQSNNGQDAQIYADKHGFWAYEPSSNTVYEGSFPADSARHHSERGHKDSAPPVSRIQSWLNRLARHLVISSHPDNIGTQPAYTVRVSPRHDGGLLGAAEAGWDAVRGVPLRFAIYARNNSTPVLELKADDISYGAVGADAFNIHPPTACTKPGTPAGCASVVRLTSIGGKGGDGTDAHGKGKHGHHAEVKGPAAVQARLPFTLTAPGTLVGLPRQTVRLLDWSGHPAALVTYGQNLGGIAVIEQTPDRGRHATSTTSGSSGKSGRRHGDTARLTLPTVSINGATGQELDTALGTMVRFTRNGVSYTVIGSVPPAAADAAARAL